LYPALRNAGLTLPDDDYQDVLHNNGFCLEEIPDFGALLPRSHEASVPVFALRNDELGATGVVQDAMIDKRDQIHDQFTTIANTLQDLMS
jgi:chromosome partitioning protein